MHYQLNTTANESTDVNYNHIHTEIREIVLVFLNDNTLKRIPSSSEHNLLILKINTTLFGATVLFDKGDEYAY